MSYTNSDGVYVRTGVSAGASGNVGALSFDGQRECLEIDISWDRLPATEVTTINTEYTVASEYVKLPIGAIIEAAELVVTVAYDDAAGGPAVLNVGTVSDDDGEADADSLIAAASLAELVVGTKLTGTSPLDGALLVASPAVQTEAKKIIWAVTGTPYASGKGNLRIFYSIADKATDALGT